MPLSARFKKTLDSITAIHHVTATHSDTATIWSHPDDLAAAAAAFRRLWELNERALQDEVSNYLESIGITRANALVVQDVWMTTDYVLSGAPGCLILEHLPQDPKNS